MKRIGFLLKVKEEMIEEYRRRHEAVWPDMLDAITRSGWHNYSCSCAKMGSFRLLRDPQQLRDRASKPRKRRGQHALAGVHEGLLRGRQSRRRHADENMVELQECFTWMRRGTMTTKVKRVRSDGLELTVETAGDGTPLIFAHGLTSNRHRTIEQLAPLARDYTIIAFDQRGTAIRRRLLMPTCTTLTAWPVIWQRYWTASASTGRLFGGESMGRPRRSCLHSVTRSGSTGCC